MRLRSGWQHNIRQSPAAHIAIPDMVTVLSQDMYLGRRAQQNEAAANRAAAAARTSGQQGGGGGGAKPACSARDSPEATSIGDPAAEELAAERHAPQEGRATGDVNHGKAAAQHRGATVAGATEAGGGGGDAEVADGVASAAAGARRNSSPVQHLRSSLQEERQAANDDNPRCAIFEFPEIKDLRAALGVKSGRRPRTTVPVVCSGCCGVWGSQWTVCCSSVA